MTDDDPEPFDAAIRQAGPGRTLTLTAESNEQRDAQATFRAALSGSDRAADIRRRIFTEPVGDDEGTP